MLCTTLCVQPISRHSPLISLQLPNGLHYEWTIKALMAGKHVLLEKPSANTAEETRKMFALAAEKKLVLLEAFHYRFHPAIRRVKAIVDSGEIGAVNSIAATMVMPPGIIKKGDIRFDYDLGGGAAMDMGCTSSILDHWRAAHCKDRLCHVCNPLLGR
jgi:predicted dehydrogenase